MNLSPQGAQFVQLHEGFVGKTFATPTAIESFTVMGSNGHGFVDTNPSVTLTIYGKKGAAPSSGT